MANENQTTKMHVKVPNLNGFDKSHEHYTTCKTGTLVPILVDEILPNSTISLGALANVDMTPFVTEFNGKIDFRLEAFFVPTRTIWGGAMNFFAQQNQYDPSLPIPAEVPNYTLTPARYGVVNSDIPTLEGYLGMVSNSRFAWDYSALPLVAYHKVFEDWYRDSRVQKALFVPTDVANNPLANLPFVQNSPTSPDLTNGVFADGKRIYDLRQRLYDRDYFTTANLVNKLDETLKVDVQDDAFTIQAIRQINALTRFSELLAGVGNRYEDVMKAVYGVYPKGLAHDKSIYLGQTRTRIYNQTTIRTTNTQIDIDDGSGTSSSASSGDATRNPYGQMAGSSVSNPSGTASNSLVDNFTTTEHGYLIVLASVVPIASYSTGIRRFLLHKSYPDFGNNLFAGMGNQPIYSSEVAENTNTETPFDEIFGWSDRYAEYKYINDRVSCGFRDYRQFSSFALKRGFSGSTSLSTSFLEIGINDLDDVTVMSGTSYSGSHRLNVGFKYHVSQPLPSYCIPTLEMLDNQHTEVVNKGGVHL
nr:MAG: major capsid protein [Microviridae sp.]